MATVCHWLRMLYLPVTIKELEEEVKCYVEGAAFSEDLSWERVAHPFDGVNLSCKNDSG